MNHGHKARTNERSADEVLGHIKSTLAIGGLFLTQFWVELFGKEGHGDVHDENGGRNNVGRHGKGMLQANHESDKHTEGFIVRVCCVVEDWGEGTQRSD